MKANYLFGGIICLFLGIYIVGIQIKTFRERKQDNLGFDLKLLGGGIMAVILGMIYQSL